MVPLELIRQGNVRDKSGTLRRACLRFGATTSTTEGLGRAAAVRRLDLPTSGDGAGCLRGHTLAGCGVSWFLRVGQYPGGAWISSSADHWHLIMACILRTGMSKS